MTTAYEKYGASALRRLGYMEGKDDYIEYSNRLVEEYLKSEGKSSENFRASDHASFGFSESERVSPWPSARKIVTSLRSFYQSLPFQRSYQGSQKKIAEGWAKRAIDAELALAKKNPETSRCIQRLKISGNDTLLCQPYKTVSGSEGEYAIEYLEKYRLLSPLLELITKEKSACKADLNIAEIGSGSGIVAHISLVHANPCKYFCVDLPGPLLYAHDLLTKVAKNLGVDTFFPALDPPRPWAPSSIIFLTPSNFFDSVPPTSIDVAISLTSLTVMSEKWAIPYVDLLGRLKPGTLVTIGHAGPTADEHKRSSVQNLVNKLEGYETVHRKTLKNLSELDGGSEVVYLRRIHQ